MRAKRILPLIVLLFVAAVTVTLAVRAQQNEWAPVPINAALTPQIDDAAFDGSNCLVVSDRVSQFARSCDGGQHWVSYNNGITYRTCMAWTLQYDAADHELIGVLNNSTYNSQSCGTNAATYWRYPDGGSGWIRIPTPAGFYTHGGAQCCGAIPKAKGDALVLGGFGCNNCVAMYSTDGGVTTHLSKIVNTSMGSFEGAYTNPFDGTILIGTENGGIDGSNDGGKSFVKIWPMQGNNGETLDTTTNCNGNIIQGSISGVWLGTGAYPNYSWQKVLNTSQRTRGTFRDPACNLFVGQRENSSSPTIQRSTDGGLTWAPYHTGIPCCLEVWHFVYDPINKKDLAVVEQDHGNQGWLYETTSQVQ